MKLHRLTEQGVAQFTAYLKNAKAEPTLAPPMHLLTEPGSCEPVADVEVDPRIFATRLDAAAYLHALLQAAQVQRPERDAGLWAWLTLFYFDQLCPAKSGKRKIGELARYVPQIDVSRRYYRHMLLGPVMMLSAHADQPHHLLPLLSSPPDVATSETYRLFIENPTLISCRAVIQTVGWLYYDRDAGRLKRGAGSKVAGGCRRLIEFLQQIDCTYDLPMLSHDRLTALLPEEFQRFVPRQMELINT